MMDTQALPEVSIVIAAYNAEETLARALESALVQENVTAEILVVDDGSTDRTAAIAEGYAERGVILIRQPANGGPAAARNAGFAAATGTWIAVLDSDDEMWPDRLSRMIRRAERNNAQMAVDNLQVVSPASPHRKTPHRRTMFRAGTLSRMPTLDLPAFIASNALFRSTHNFGYMKPIFERRFLEKHGIRFDESLRIGEDYIFLASALARGGRCVVEPQPGYVYNIREGSISRVLHLDDVEAMMRADAAFIRGHRLSEQALAAQAYRTRSLREARSFLTLVDNIKSRSLPQALKTAWRDPMAVRHLRMPVAARLRRMRAAFMASRRSQPVSVSKG